MDRTGRVTENQITEQGNDAQCLTRQAKTHKSTQVKRSVGSGKGIGSHIKMTINEYQAYALRTAGQETGDELLTNGVMGLCGEAGEAVDIVKKYLFQGHPLETEKLLYELGDVAWYLAVTAHSLGCSLETVLWMNVRKLERRYPEGFSAERSVGRCDDT